MYGLDSVGPIARGMISTTINAKGSYLREGFYTQQHAGHIRNASKVCLNSLIAKNA